MSSEDRDSFLERAASTFQHAPCGLFSTDEHGLIRSANPTLVAWLERPLAEVIGHLRFTDILTPGARIYASTHLLPMLRVRGGFDEIALVLRSPSGIERNVLLSAQAHEGSDPFEGWATFVAFPAEHRRAYERELAFMRAAAQTRASWLRQVETMAGVGAWLLDVDSQTVSWSDQIFRLHDLPIGASLTAETALSFYQDEAREVMAQCLDKVIVTGEPFEVESAIVTATGRRRHVRTRGEAEWENGRVRRVAGVFEDITEQHEAKTRLWHYAHVDALSGLANRHWFQQRLNPQVEAAARQSLSFALLLVDLDNFKDVNDTLGHQAGDEVIRVVASRIKDCAGDEAFVARLGGDEFAMLTNSGAGPHSLSSLAERIQMAIRQTISIEGGELVLSASIGGARFPDDAATAEQLLRGADSALYAVKHSGGGAFRMWSEATATAVGLQRASTL